MLGYAPLRNFLRGCRLACRTHSLPYGYQSLWLSSLLCPLCDWSFLASAEWRSALHLLPSSHQIHTGSKQRKMRKTGALGVNGGKPIFEFFCRIQGVYMLVPEHFTLAVCHKSFHRGLLHKDLTVKLIQSREHKTTLPHPWWQMLLWNGPSFICLLDEGLKRACPLLLRILVQKGTEEIVSRGKPYSRAFSESPEKLEGNGPIANSWKCFLALTGIS